MTEKLAPRSAREPQGTAVGSGSLSTLFRHGHIHVAHVRCGLVALAGESPFRFFCLVFSRLGFRLSLRDARNRLWLSQCCRRRVRKKWWENVTPRVTTPCETYGKRLGRAV